MVLDMGHGCTHQMAVGLKHNVLMCAGADDFLPVLIYVVIHANPPQLASNLEYIQRFRMHSRMVSESAYFFTQLVCHLKPIQCYLFEPLICSSKKVSLR